jgi:hypothetical protein
MAFAAVGTTLNNWGSTLDGAVLVGDGTIDVADASLLVMPCYLTAWNEDAYGADPAADGDMEILYATNKVGNTLTVTRGIGPTSPAAHGDGDSIKMHNVAELYDEIFAEMNKKLYNDADDATTGKFGVNVPVPVAQLDVEASGAAVVGLRVDGAAAQSADFLQLRNSAGSTLVSFDSDGFQFFDNTSLSMASDISVINMDIEKTAGASNNTHTLDGLQMAIEMNHNGATIGRLMGVDIKARVTDGTVDGQSDLSVRPGNFLADLNGGIVLGDVFGIHAQIDQEAANSVTGDAFGIKIQADMDGTLTGLAYMLYLQEATGIDFGVYQNGTAPNRFGGRVGVNVATPAAMIDADQSDSSGAVPVLQLDQADNV